MKGVVVNVNRVRGMAVIETEQGDFMAVTFLSAELDKGDRISGLPFDDGPVEIFNATQQSNEEICIETYGGGHQNALSQIS